MRLQKQETRKIGGKKYSKWVITLPESVIKHTGWKEGDELGFRMLNDGVILFSASIKKRENEIVYRESTHKKVKFSPIERFVKIYDNLPVSERGEVVVVVSGEPYTWTLVRNQIIHNTPLGKEILKKLVELEII